MKISTLQVSKYLKKEDFERPALLTIAGLAKVDISQPGEAAKERGVLSFVELDKGMVMNQTNLKRAARICGSDESDDWKGKKIVVFNDETVEFAGDVIGGLRVRAPSKPAPSRAPEIESPPDFDYAEEY